VPLLIDLKPGEKLIINGAVVENAGANTKIRILNDSAILRQKEILSDTDCVTPASRVYFCLQCAYIFPDARGKYLQSYNQYLDDYVKACPSAAAIADDIQTALQTSNLYRALKAARLLLKHETQTIGRFQAQVRQGADGGPPTDED
jgi:flagellar protein FlbT